MKSKWVLAASACMMWCGAAVQAADPEMKPSETEVWSPLPPRVTPGMAPGAPPSDAIVLFDGKGIDGWKSAKDGSAARWTVANGELIVAPGTGDIQTREKF